MKILKAILILFFITGLFFTSCEMPDSGTNDTNDNSTTDQNTEDNNSYVSYYNCYNSGLVKIKLSNGKTITCRYSLSDLPTGSLISEDSLSSYQVALFDDGYLDLIEAQNDAYNSIVPDYSSINYSYVSVQYIDVYDNSYMHDQLNVTVLTTHYTSLTDITVDSLGFFTTDFTNDENLNPPNGTGGTLSYSVEFDEAIEAVTSTGDYEGLSLVSIDISGVVF